MSIINNQATKILETVGPTNVDAEKLKGLSIPDASMLVLLDRADTLEKGIRRQIDDVRQKNDDIGKLGKIQTKLRTMQTQTKNVTETSWEVKSEENPKVIQLDNGYKIEIPGERESWTIVDGDGNRSTIWGDPYVEESDASGANRSERGADDEWGRDWELREQSTFILGDGTKITVGMKQKEGYSNNYVYSDKLTITKGNQSVVVTGIESNNPEIGSPSLDGGRLDAETNDGYVFKMGDNAADWMYHQGEGRELGQGGYEHVTADGEVIYEHDDGDNFQQMLTPEEKKLLNDLGIEIGDNSGVGALTNVEINNVLSSIESSVKSLTSVSQTDVILLQSQTAKYDQTNSLQSAITKQQMSASKEIIRAIQ